MQIQTTRKRVDQKDEAFAKIAEKALSILHRIPIENGQSEGSYWRPYSGTLDIDGFRFSVSGSKQCQFGSNDFGEFQIQLLKITQKGNKRTETTEDVLKFEYFMENGHQHLVLDPLPLRLRPKTDDHGKIQGKFSPGTWQRKFADFLKPPSAHEVEILMDASRKLLGMDWTKRMEQQTRRPGLRVSEQNFSEARRILNRYKNFFVGEKDFTSAEDLNTVVNVLSNNSLNPKLAITAQLLKAYSQKAAMGLLVLASKRKSDKE